MKTTCILKKILLLSYLALFLVPAAFTQQNANFSMYYSNGLFYNPAYAGSHDAVSLNAGYRYQWAGMPGAPQTATGSVHSPLKNERIAIGAIYSYDRVGVTKTNSADISFAYRIPIGKKKETKICIGVSAGFKNYRADLNSVATTDADDAAFTGNSQNRWLPDAGFGIYIYSRKFFAGSSLSNILFSRLNGKTSVFEGSPVVAHQYPHLYLTTGYVLNISSVVKFIPSALFRYVPGHAPISFDFNASFIFLDRIRLGASYRLEDCYVFMVAGHVTKQLRIGYAYDLSVSPVRKYTSGSHEVTFGFDFSAIKGKGRNPAYIAHF